MENMNATGRLHCDVFGALGPPKTENSKMRTAVRGTFAGSTLIGSLDDMQLEDILGGEEDIVIDPRRDFRASRTHLNEAMREEINDSLEISRRRRELK